MILFLINFGAVFLAILIPIQAALMNSVSRQALSRHHKLGSVSSFQEGNMS